ncbi:MAG: hypothetical protein BWY70_00244 [Bacteroidetes bacterium ADurb.Bin408]|nr:MAG: hypothetical protein BWY70_00244 [Bacteroidetes bacterium ADurb.Bin408]
MKKFDLEERLIDFSISIIEIVDFDFCKEYINRRKESKNSKINLKSLIPACRQAGVFNI